MEGRLAEEEEEESLDGREEERERETEEDEAEGLRFPSDVRGVDSRSRRSFSHCSYCSSFLNSPMETKVSKESSSQRRVELVSNPPPLLPPSLPFAFSIIPREPE